MLGTALSAAARLSRLRPLPRIPGALGSPANLVHASLSRRSSQTPAMPASWIPTLCLGGYAPSPPRPRGRRLQPPSCPFSAGAWLLLLLLPRLALAEGAGELDAGGGGREDREGGKEAEDLRGMPDWSGGEAPAPIPYVPWVRPGSLPGSTPSSSWDP